MYPQQIGRLSHLDLGQAQIAPVQALDVGGSKNKVNYKALYTSDYWIRPVFGKPRLNVDYGELEVYESNILIRMVTNHIIDSVCSTDFDIVPIKEEDEVSDEIQKQIDAATEFFGARKWMESLDATLRRMLPDLLFYDCGLMIKVFPKNCYDENSVLRKNNKEPPVALMARDGRSFLLDSTPFGEIEAVWQYSFMNLASYPRLFDPEEIIYLQMRPQSRSIYGIANLQIIKDVVDYLNAAVTAQRSYYENNFPISGAIDHPDIVDPDELKARAQMYKETLKGESNTGKWLITAGGTKVTPLQISAQTMQWLESTEYFQKLIFAMFKISPTQLGFTEQVNRATAITQSQNYKENGVKVVLNFLENYFNREIIWKYFGEEIEFKYDDSLDLQDKKQQVDTDHVSLTDGTITINEIRTRDGNEEFTDEECNAPFAQMALQQKLMEGSMGGEEEGGEYGGWGEEPEAQPGEEETSAEEAAPETPAEKLEKAVTAEAPMGAPGAALIPTVWDSATKKKKKKEAEDAEEETKDDLDKWSVDVQKNIEKELRQLYKESDIK
jgi:HK97 family phage portal protein